MRRAFALVVEIVALAAVFTVALAASVILHLRLAPPRRVLVAGVNTALERSFAGKITVQRLGAIGLTRIEGVDAEVLDPEGRLVVSVRGLRARIETFSLIRSLVHGGALEVRLPEIAADAAEIVLEQSAAGELSLERAFEPRGIAGPHGPVGPGPRPVHVALPDLHVAHAWVHGHLATVPVLDADLDDLQAAFTSTPESTEILVDHALVRARGLRGTSLEGTVVGSATLPADPSGARQVSLRYQGRVGEILVRAHGSLSGDEVTAVVDVPETAPAAFAALAPGVFEPGAPVAVHAEVHGRLPVHDGGSPGKPGSAPIPPVLRLAFEVRVGPSEIEASGTVKRVGASWAEMVVSAQVDARDLDLHLLHRGAPPSRLTAEMAVRVASQPGGKLSGAFQIRSSDGLLRGRRLPGARASGDFTDRGVRGSAWIEDHRAPTRVRFSLQRRRDELPPRDLTVAAEATIPDLGALPLGAAARGRAHLALEGRMDLVTKQVSGSAAVEVAGLEVKGVQLGRGEVTVAARGPVESPHVEVRAHGSAMRAAGYAFPDVYASVVGSRRMIEFTAGSRGDPRSPRIAVHGEVSQASPSASPTLAIDAAVHGLSLAALPPSFGQRAMTGEVDLSAELRGTTRAPDLTLTARGAHLLPRGASSCVRPVNVAVNVHYEGGSADARLAAVRDGRTILGGDATVKLDLAEALAGRTMAWVASGGVTLSRFPLDEVGDLLGRTIAGEVSGRLDVTDLHRAASLSANLDVRDLSLDHAVFPGGNVHVVVNGGAISASARLQQVDGYADVQVTGAASWGAALVPVLDPAKPVEASLRAANLRAAAAMPFVRGVFSELDGRIDADARIHVEPGGRDGLAEGAVTLRDGVFAVPEIGERFHALAGRVVMRRWGTLVFEGFSAETGTGRLTAKADVDLDGLAFRHANAEIHVARGESIPVTFEGVPLGRASGDVMAHARMSPDGRRLDVGVTVPSLHVDLPQATAKAVQSLDPDPSVRIGIRAGAEIIPVLTGPPPPPPAPPGFATHVVVALGDDVEVRRDTTLALTVVGRVALELGEETRVSGQILVTRGTIDIKGKQFTVDHGSVSFVGNDPADPLILATASWDAPDGTRVLADFSGHPTTGRLSLQSDPARSQDEILALILFGSPEGSFGAEVLPGQASPAVAAAGLAGNLVTQALNKAISGITSVGITTRVDTSQANSPQPEVSVQISRNVTARLGFKLGVPAPGENPDRTELTLDWRLVRDWSLTAVVGDQGSTSLDLAWRLRY